MSWYKKYLAKSANHDYDPSWDYELDEAPDNIAKTFFENAAREIQNMPQIKSVNNFQIHYVTNTGNDLAKYIDGTSSRPIIVVNLNMCIEASKKHNVDLYTVAKSTLLHELKHAMQDAAGEEMDEDKAEGFASSNIL